MIAVLQSKIVEHFPLEKFYLEIVLSITIWYFRVGILQSVNIFFFGKKIKKLFSLKFVTFLFLGGAEFSSNNPNPETNFTKGPSAKHKKHRRLNREQVVSLKLILF